MKEYQNKQKQFGTSEKALQVENKQRQQKQQQQQQKQEQQINDDNDDDYVNDSNQGFNNTEIICNVCLTVQDDILCFSCLSIRSHLTMINIKVKKISIKQLQFFLFKIYSKFLYEAKYNEKNYRNSE